MLRDAIDLGKVVIKLLELDRVRIVLVDQGEGRIDFLVMDLAAQLLQHVPELLPVERVGLRLVELVEHIIQHSVAVPQVAPQLVKALFDFLFRLERH